MMNCWLLAEPFTVPQLYRTFKTFTAAHRWATQLLYGSHWHWQNDGSLLGYFNNDAGQCLVFAAAHQTVKEVIS